MLVRYEEKDVKYCVLYLAVRDFQVFAYGLSRFYKIKLKILISKNILCLKSYKGRSALGGG